MEVKKVYVPSISRNSDSAPPSRVAGHEQRHWRDAERRKLYRAASSTLEGDAGGSPWPWWSHHHRTDANRKTWEFLSRVTHKMKKRFIRFAGVTAFLGALAILIPVIGVILSTRETIDDWFVVHSLEIQDYKVGDDPIITFDRTIYKDLSGQWSVETQQRRGDSWVTICKGFGLSHYSPDEALPPNGVTLNWFRDKCEDQPGEHRLQVVWQFTDSRTGSTKARIITTDNFIVTR